MKFNLKLNKHIRIFGKHLWYCVDLDPVTINNFLHQPRRSYNEKGKMELQISGRSLPEILEERAIRSKSVCIIFLN